MNHEMFNWWSLILAIMICIVAWIINYSKIQQHMADRGYCEKQLQGSQWTIWSKCE